MAMMFNGRVVLAGTLREVQQDHHRLVFRFEAPQSSPPRLPGVLSLTGDGKEWTAVRNGRRAETTAAAERLGGRMVAESAPSLDEIFVALSAAKPE